MTVRMTGWMGLALAVAALPAAADSLDFNLSSDAAKLSYTRDLGPEGLEAGAGLLHHDDDGEIFEGELHLVDRPEPGREALLLGIGGKVPVISDDRRDADGAALAIGGKLHYTLPMYNRAAVAADLYFAPSVTSVSDIDGYQEYAVRGEFKVLEDASVYLGYRNIELSYDGNSLGGDRDYEDGVYGGLRIDF